MKAKTILLTLGSILAIVDYTLAIIEHLYNVGIFNFLYSTIDKSAVFYALIFFGTALTAFILGYSLKSRIGKKVEIAFLHMRPRWATGEPDYISDDYGVEWRMFIPPERDVHLRPWADGPYCPECKRDLEIKKNKLGKSEWFCPLCDTSFPMPEGDVKVMVEKNFAAYLRKKRRI